ncbi:penicillin-binding transpeptidase domain-containing protein [Nocardiopsis sediminis]|uniref:Penicillin-binding transpeptidase domain-containing protein n=1 Tax=Nocardiopsis sediminis TaxID=1778267 RepID=A0ABV8FLD2_9ACTN
MDERWTPGPGDDRPAPPENPRPYPASGPDPHDGAGAPAAPDGAQPTHGPPEAGPPPAPPQGSRPSPYTLPSALTQPSGAQRSFAPGARGAPAPGPQDPARPASGGYPASDLGGPGPRDTARPASGGYPAPDLGGRPSSPPHAAPTPPAPAPGPLPHDTANFGSGGYRAADLGGPAPQNTARPASGGYPAADVGGGSHPSPAAPGPLPHETGRYGSGGYPAAGLGGPTPQETARAASGGYAASDLGGGGHPSAAAPGSRPHDATRYGSGGYAASDVGGPGHPTPGAASPGAHAPYPAPSSGHDGDPESTAAFAAVSPERPGGPSGPGGPQWPSGPQTPYGAAAGAPDDEPGEPRRKSRKGVIIGVTSAVVVLALVGGGVSWYVLTMPQPEETVSAFADAWNEEDYAAMAALATGDGVEDALTGLDTNLGIDQARITAGDVSADGDTATAPFTADLSLSNAGDWSYEGELPLVRVDGEWRVEFSPAVMHPELGEGQTLTRVNEWGERGAILAADGTRLDTPEATGSVAMIVGQVGEVAEENLEDLGPAYKVGDPTGVSGLQRTYEEQLAGSATTTIRVAEAGAEEAAAEDADPVIVGELGGADGEDITTSIDPAIQAAAAQAISGQSKPTALVAVRPSTGEVLAVANMPDGFNRAVEGQYPAGSTFKIVSYDALLSNGMTMDEPMDCPKTTEVGGWEFKNAGDAEHGAQTVTEAFATSCNTALVQKVAERLDSAALVGAAEQFGFNSELQTGLSAFDPVFPTPDSTTLLAASSLGQGQMLTSPLHMATVPAAVADGSWRSPVFVTDPEVTDRPEPTPIANAEALRAMTRAVVTEGTAENVGFTGEVHGKTGTAEYGTAEEDEDLPAHAWFVGYEGDIAFSVLVEDGEGGAKDAAPLGKAFLDAL